MAPVQDAGQHRDGSSRWGRREAPASGGPTVLRANSWGCQQSTEFTSVRRKKRLGREGRSGRLSAGSGRGPWPDRCSDSVMDGTAAHAPHPSSGAAPAGSWKETVHPGMPDTIPLQAEESIYCT